MASLRYLPGVATLELDAGRCNGCTLCTQVCPHDVFALENKKARIRDLDACMECGACERNCPTGAIRVRSGVGCASGILTGWLRRSEPICDCGEDTTYNNSSCC